MRSKKEISIDFKMSCDHITPTRMAIIEKQTNKTQKVTSVGKDAEKLESLCLAAGNKMVQLLWKTVLRFLKKLNIELSYDPAIPRIGVNSKELKAGTQILIQHCS